MENATENKARFFALYWGQKVMMTHTHNNIYGHHGLSGRMFVDVNTETVKPSWFLELTPLSQISDEDAISFFDILWAKVGDHKNKSIEFKIQFGKDWAESPFSERYGLIPTGLFHGVDFLRSKGYALPWMGLSVAQLIEYGWVKLKEEKK